jgi:hypothetical protein
LMDHKTMEQEGTKYGSSYLKHRIQAQKHFWE